MAADVSFAKITIATDDDLSSAVNCIHTIPVAIQVPSSITSSSISFTASANIPISSGNPAFQTYGTLYNSLGQVSYSIAANRYVLLDPSDFSGVRSFKIVTASGEAADRTFAVILRSDA